MVVVGRHSRRNPIEPARFLSSPMAESIRIVRSTRVPSFPIFIAAEYRASGREREREREEGIYTVLKKLFPDNRDFRLGQVSIPPIYSA